MNLFKLKNIKDYNIIKESKLPCSPIKTSKNSFPFNNGKIFVHKDQTSPDWGNDINTVSTRKISITSTNYSAIIIFSYKHDYYALSYNHGYNLLKNSYIDTSFGINVIRKLLYPTTIKHIDSFHPWTDPKISYTIMSNGRKYIPQYKQLINDDPMIIKTISGKCKLIINTAKQKNKQVILALHGNSSLTINGPIDISTDLKPIIQKIDSLETLSLPMWNNEIQPITQSYDHKLCNNRLEKKLESIFKATKTHTSIKGTLFKNMFLYVDHSLQDSKFTIRNVPIDNKKKFSNLEDTIHLERVFKFLIQKSDNQKKLISIFKKMTVPEYDDQEQTINTHTLFNCLYYEFRQKNTSFFLYQGTWYKIDRTLTKWIVNSISNIPLYPNTHFRDMNTKTDYEIKNKKKVSSENKYTELICKSQPTLNKLDKQLFNPKTKLANEHGGIEICDILESNTTDLNFICLKPGRSGASFSHLISQARNSMTFLMDYKNPDVLNFINNQLKDQNFCITKEKFKKSKKCIVLGIIDAKIDTKKILSTQKESLISLFPIGSVLSIYSLKQDLAAKNVSLKLLLIGRK